MVGIYFTFVGYGLFVFAIRHCSASSDLVGGNDTMGFSSITRPTATSPMFPQPYVSSIPDIDTCGAASGNATCPGAGVTRYYYRCCSSAGHCGPKNNIQDQALYCGSGCQQEFGSCGTNFDSPPNPTGTAGTALDGDTCGPIVNSRCVSGLCCSGSNYCGIGTEFCGSANWCQADWGDCSDS